MTSSTNVTSPRGVSEPDATTVPEDCLVFDTEAGEFLPWDNAGNVISQEVERLVDAAVGCLSLGLFCISVPCNVLNMLVFCKQGLQERINLCLFALSLADFLHMLFSFFYNVDRLYLPFSASADSGPVLEFMVRHHLVGLRNFGWLSGFISMVIACERCLCVYSPLRSQTVLKTKTTAAILLVAALPLVTGYMLVGLRWSLVCVYDPETASTYRTFYTGPIYLQHQQLMNVLSLILGGVQPLIFVSVVMVTTILTSVKLHRMVHWRQKTSSATLSSREVALTRTLIAISVLFVVCSLPIMITGTMSMFVEEFTLEGRYHNLGKMCVSFFELASYINATFNFFVYCFLGSKYRQTLRALFPCKQQSG